MGLFDGIKNAVAKIGQGIKSVATGVVKTVKSAVNGFATGGIVGAVIGGVKGAIDAKDDFVAGVQSIKSGVQEIKQTKTTVEPAIASVQAVKTTAPLQSISALASSPVIKSVANIADASGGISGSTVKSIFSWSDYNMTTEKYKRG